MTAIYTSANLRYLAKARTLAESVRKHNPDTTFYLVLVDTVPDTLRCGIENRSEPFDHVLTPHDLDIPDVQSWLFHHDVVEACTAVKAAALAHLFEHYNEDRVLYLDPDIVVFNPLDDLFSQLSEASLLLTPHCSVAETDTNLIIRNEISSLAHGAFNLGFLGVAADCEGLRFTKWWCQRLYRFCHADIPRGLFTDQKWIDLVPGQFEGVRIVRDPAYNVATWNITQRTVSGMIPDDLLVDDIPLSFYHFSGVGDPTVQVTEDCPRINSPIVTELIKWYFSECDRNGENDCRQLEWRYGQYDNGDPVPTSHRVYYRSYPELQKQFSDPFAVGEDSFYEWLSSPSGPGLIKVERLYGQSVQVLRQNAEQLLRIEQSVVYRLYVSLRQYI